MLLGPQRRPSLESALSTIGVDGPIATVTAGWQDRELADEELDSYLAGGSHNLRLWQRQQELFEADPELAQADQRRQERREELQSLYLIGVGHAMEALNELLQTSAPGFLRDDAVQDADLVLHDLDRRHLERVAQLEAGFFAKYRPHEREAVVRHRHEVAQDVARSAAVIITGGHVAVLLDLLHLFNVGPLLGARPVIAWSAGAMVLTERVVLFNDRATHGHAHPEVYGQGLSLVRDVVALPDAHRRLAMDDNPRMASMARRFAPAWCLPLDPGARIVFGADRRPPSSAPVIGWDGDIAPLGDLMTAAALAGSETGTNPQTEAVDE